MMVHRDWQVNSAKALSGHAHVLHHARREDAVDSLGGGGDGLGGSGQAGRLPLED